MPLEPMRRVMLPIVAGGLLVLSASCSAQFPAVSAVRQATTTAASGIAGPGPAAAASGIAGPGSAAAAGAAGNSVTGNGKASSGGRAACATLTAADVQFLMADKVSAEPKTTAIGTDSDGEDCDFLNADQDENVEVTVFPSSDPTFGYDAQIGSKPHAVPVAGVGNRAFRDPDDYDPTADGNGITCSVSASIDQVPAAAGLIQGGHSITLTTPQADAVATALGTLCNRIFKSGNTTPDLGILHK